MRNALSRPRWHRIRLGRAEVRPLVLVAGFVAVFILSFIIAARVAKWRDSKRAQTPPAGAALLGDPGDDLARINSSLYVGGALEPPAGDSISQDALLASAGPFEPSAPDLKRFHYTIKNNDNFYTALKHFNVPHELIMSWCELAKDKFNFENLKPGQSFFLYAGPGDEFVKLEFNISGANKLIIDREGGEHRAHIEVIEKDSEAGEEDVSIPLPAWVSPGTGFHYYRGVVDNNFYDSALAAGMTPKKAMAVISVFGYVNFGRDLKKGDNFSVVTAPGESEGEEGPILAAMIETRGKPRYVFRFEDKGRAGYFDEKGKSSRRSNFICPVRYKKISSGYTHRRLHPILKKYRPHLGVDYVTTAGTPVKAAANGKVVYAGWKKGYGRTVKIKHNKTYQTQYAHLSRYSKSAKKGRRVKQGQVIGYVGSTGLSTGPHLDYRVYRNGKPVNPLKYTSMPGPPVKDKKSFEETKAQIHVELDRPLPLGPPTPWPRPEGETSVTVVSGR
jgi:murein DD-endopeptidase MepM/ murein hydrolase activator NlpD